MTLITTSTLQQGLLIKKQVLTAICSLYPLLRTFYFLGRILSSQGMTKKDQLKDTEVHTAGLAPHPSSLAKVAGFSMKEKSVNSRICTNEAKERKQWSYIRDLIGMLLQPASFQVSFSIQLYYKQQTIATFKKVQWRGNINLCHPRYQDNHFSGVANSVCSLDPSLSAPAWVFSMLCHCHRLCPWLGKYTWCQQIPRNENKVLYK